MGRLGFGALVAVLVGLALSPAWAAGDSAVCGIETARQEQRQAIPDRLLHAISLVESGRWDADRQASFAWPWTVTAEGEGRYLPSKAAAIAEVRALKSRGVRNIDVGCMQVNLQAHPNAFASLEDAFDPASNVAYAARFLIGLHDSTQDWPTAAAYYHSQTPELAAPYKTRLMATWDAARRHTDKRLQLAAFEEPSGNRPPLGLMIPPKETAPPSHLLPLRTQTAAMPAAPNLIAKAAAAQARTATQRLEAKHIADAYRQARLEEYRLRKAQTGRS